MKLHKFIPILAAAAALGSCEQKNSSRSSTAPPPAPLAQTVATHSPPPPAAAPTAPSAPAGLADPFELLDRAQATPAPKPRDPEDVQKEAIRRARELRAESDRVREVL
jgi:hypothetical protein